MSADTEALIGLLIYLVGTPVAAGVILRFGPRPRDRVDVVILSLAAGIASLLWPALLALTVVGMVGSRIIPHTD